MKAFRWKAFGIILIWCIFVLVPATSAAVTQENTIVKVGEERCELCLIKIDMDDPCVRIDSVLAGESVGEQKKLPQILKRVEKQGGQIIAAINGSYFEPDQSGKTRLWSTLQRRGSFVHIGDFGTVMGVNGDGKLTFAHMVVKIIGRIKGEKDEQSFDVWGLNHSYIEDEAVAIFTSAYGKYTPEGERWAITVENNRVIAISTGTVPISVNGFVVVTGSQEKVDLFQEGEQVEYELAFVEAGRQDGYISGDSLDWSEMRTTVGAGPLLIKQGVIVLDAVKEGFQEEEFVSEKALFRSFIGQDMDGRLVLGVARFVTLHELSQALLEEGLVEAMNLDGGISSSMMLGDESLVGPYRKITDAIVITRFDVPPVRVFINEQELFYETDPVIQNNRTLVPLAKTCKALGVNYTVNEDEERIQINKGNTTVSFTLGDTNVQVNGKDHLLDTAPFKTEEKIYIPLRFLAEVFDLQVIWHPSRQITLNN
ncbi:MAG: phosphodiester glycosidase family protein [Bacillota bacterium]|nr:phosphodiester glycosidase family protein [Bacillota bacterium]